MFDYSAEKNAEGDTPIAEDALTLSSLDGLSHDEVFSEHLHGALANAGISGGVLKFHFSKRTGQLHGLTTFELQRPLDPKEIDLLLDFTLGQWCDGIGANFFQSRMDFGLAPQMFTPRSTVTIQKFD
nr:hypothetical protein [uncultured Rhodoferax sp.]